MKNDKPSKQLSNTTAERIIDYILVNNLTIGDRIPNEYELADMLGTSRNTVREAIRQLVSRNVLVVKQGAGTFVSKDRGIPEDPLGLTFIQNDPGLALELLDVRLLVEPAAAEQAAIHASEEQIEAMIKLCHEIKELAESGEPYYEEDKELHRLIGECCGNSILRNLMSIMADSSEISIRVTKDRYRDMAFIEHWRVVRAIQRRDPLGARNAMIAHLTPSRETISEKKAKEIE
jgi:DNA-binding FadR family transcriptional regulator